MINSEESIFPMFMSLAILPNPTGCRKHHKCLNHARIKYDNKIPKTCNTKRQHLNTNTQGQESNYNNDKNSFKFNRNLLSTESIESQISIRKISTFYEKSKHIGIKGTSDTEMAAVKFLCRPLLYKIPKSPISEELKIS